jgi:hypothetical protein
MPTIITRGTVSAQGFGFNAAKSGLTSGQVYGGGYYAVQILYPTGTKYNLVVSPKASGDFNSKTFGGDSGATSTYDGYSNSALIAAAWGTGAAYTCRNLNINGYTDWYLPAKWELEVLFWYLKATTDLNNPNNYGANPYAVSPEPVSTYYTTTSPLQTTATLFQTGNSEALTSGAGIGFYWTSTQYDTTNAWYQLFSTVNPGAQNNAAFSLSVGARAIRRVAV